MKVELLLTEGVGNFLLPGVTFGLTWDLISVMPEGYFLLSIS
jgi:hypothetical protein